MKKFILMILSVSVFFIGLGGIVKHVGAKLKSDLGRQATFIQNPASAESEEKTDFGKSAMIFEKSKRPLIIKRGKDESAHGSLEFNLRVPNQADRMIILPRKKSGETLIPGEEFPPIGDKNVITLRPGEPAKFEILETEKKEEKTLSVEDKIKIVRQIRQQ